MPEMEIRNIATGRPVNPKLDLNPDISREKTARSIIRSNVRSAREMSNLNQALAKGTPRELGRTAIKISQQFASGKIDIYA